MDIPLIPIDTPPEAFRALVAAYRRMTPERRWERVCELSDAARRLTEEGVRFRHPHYTDREVRLAATRLRLGDELFAQVYPGVDVRP